MAEVSNVQNLNSHYSPQAKTVRSRRAVAVAPDSLPKHHLFNDIDANNRMNAINQDIYQDSKKEESKFGRNFVKVFGGLVLGILAFIGLRRVFKKS